MKKEMLRMLVLGAALSGLSFTGFTMAADDATPPAKPAQTQPPAPPANGGRRNFNPADILKNYRDQFEGINLTDDQMKKIDGFIQTAQTEVDKAGTSQDQETRRAAFQAIRKLNEDVQSVLTDDQKTALRTKRIGQMFDRMKTEYTADNLKLTDDQKTKINQIIDDAKKAALAAPPPDPNANGGRRGGQGFQAMRDMREKIDAVLTPDQQKLLPQRGGRRGQGGPGGGAGGTPPPAPNN